MRNKGIPEVLVRSVISLNQGAKISGRVDSDLWEELEVKVEMHHGSVLSPSLLAVVVDVFRVFAREGALCELLHAVLMRNVIEGLRYKFISWKEAFEYRVRMLSLAEPQ